MDKLKKHEYSMDSCNHCGQCKWILPPKMYGWDFAEVCPIHNYHGFDAYSGQGLLNISKEVITGRLKIGEGLEKVLYSCTACGACDVNCKNVRDIEVLEPIYALRELCVREGSVPEALKEEVRQMHCGHNIHGLPHVRRFDFLPEGFEDDPEADTALFFGCSVYTHPEIALAAIKILRAGGLKFRLLWLEEHCCGGRLWRNGFVSEAEEIIKDNMDAFRAEGIKTIITPCAECFGAFRGIYPRFVDMDIEVLHMSQVALRLLNEGRIRLKALEKPIKLTYHDPCMLGRLSEKYVPWEGEIKPFGLHVPEKTWRRGENGVYFEPRELIKAIPGAELLEMPRNLENAYCCASHSAKTDPEMSAFAANERRREAASTGAETIVSCCPHCIDALGGEIPALELCVLVADCLEEGGRV